MEEIIKDLILRKESLIVVERVLRMVKRMMIIRNVRKLNIAIIKNNLDTRKKSRKGKSDSLNR